ncbi:peptide alpha-n-acetyltransferase [Trichoderma arundinaceum]|uniref:Peptide alpha-n-acetyltransferase n=1 Tax=Trichoderma arundinaceum TaxID=490622 RepID=A0A395NLD3_TRIAR|nr:peptide alpha-n-acetyltransferase [Trichoderma arundinaceum]
MLRAAFQSKAIPLREAKAASVQFGALRDVWARLFSSQPAARSQSSGSNALSWKRLHSIQPWRGTVRHSVSMRPNARIADNFARGAQRRSFVFSAWRRNTAQGAKKSLTLSERFKKLSREYGWSAVGVYFALSVLDFPFCFLLVKVVGTERIGQVEHFVVSKVAKLIPESVREEWREYRASLKREEQQHLGGSEISDKVEMVGWGVEQAQERNKEEASEFARRLPAAIVSHDVGMSQKTDFHVMGLCRLHSRV